MPYAGGIYTLPPGTAATTLTPVDSSDYNTFIADIEAAQNAARPISAGGTGQTTAVSGHDALVTRSTDVASAATLNLDNATGMFADITGTTTVTAVTLASGRQRLARAVGVFQLTASASLIVNGSTTVNYATLAGDLLLFEAYGSSVVRVWVISPAALPSYSDATFRLHDNGDATKQLAFQLSGITAGQTRTLTPPNADATILGGNVEDQTISGGARVTPKDLGNLSGQSITPDPGDRPIQKVTNNGAGSILPGSNEGQYTLQVINTSNAGAITTTGWTLRGDVFDPTTTSKFLCSCFVTSDLKVMTILKVA